jgi:hypothetical protein
MFIHMARFTSRPRTLATLKQPPPFETFLLTLPNSDIHHSFMHQIPSRNIQVPSLADQRFPLTKSAIS